MYRNVKAILVRKGIRQKQLAAEIGVLPATVSGVLNGHHNSRHIKDAIAKKLNMDFEKLWGKAV